MFKILSIDGGGIKGVFPISFLTEIEKHTKNKIADYFDLITGTSTGGIIALGLGLGLPAKDILNFYEKYGPRIFKKETSLFKVKFFSPKHDLTLLEKSLKIVFKDKKIGHSSTRLLIPALNTKTGLPYVYKTAHHKDFFTDYKVDMVDAALSTASAPAFFKSFKSKNGVTFIDGGIWAQNPILLSVIESLTFLKQSPKNIRILSLGCTTNPLDYSKTTSWGFGQWAFNISEVFTSAQSFASLNMSQILMKKKNIIRIDQLNHGPKLNLDDVRSIESLRAFGELKARDKYSSLKNIFFNKIVKKYKPIRKL